MEIVTWLLMLTTLIGCTKNSEVSSENAEKNVNGNKGGYVEEIIKVSDDLRCILDVTKLDNGDLILCGADNAFNERVFVSSDNGSSWSEREIKHLTFEEEVKVKTLNLLNNGNILIAYGFVDCVKYAMANANGEVDAIDLEVKQGISSEGLNYAPIVFTSLNNGDFVYKSMDNGEVVQIDGNSLKEKFRYDGGLMYSIAINLGDKLIINSMDNVSIYDMNTGQPIKGLENKLIKNDQVGVFINSKSDKDLYNYSTEGL